MPTIQSNPSLRRASVLGLVAFLALTTSACCKSDGNKCPDNYRGLPADKQAGENTCTCDPGSATGPVWGTDIYTTDSSICNAAVHAGVIPSSGGSVNVKGAPGCPAYFGTLKNGVTSDKWDSYDSSFYFPGHGDGKCAAAAPAGTACPGRFHDIPGLNATTSITCTCSSANMAGSVWGTDTYTQDSSICGAAQHAGVITASGGTVTAKASPGCKSYSGTNRNGVTSSGWESYDASFFFPGKGTGACQ